MIQFLVGVFVGALLGSFAGLFWASLCQAADRPCDCPELKETLDEYIKRKAQERD